MVFFLHFFFLVTWESLGKYICYKFNFLSLKIFMHNFYFLWTFWDSNIFIFLYASSICWTAREGGQVPGLRTVQRVQSRDPLPPPPPPRAPPGPGPWLISIPHISYVSKLNINDGNSNYSQCYLRITHYLIVSVSSSIPNNGVKGQRIRIISHRCVKLVLGRSIFHHIP